MAQQTMMKSGSKEWSFTISNTEINTWSSTPEGIIVSGRTEFCMNADSITMPNYVIPDFKKTLTGTLSFDADIPVVELKRIPIEEAKQLIHKYLRDHPGSRTSDLILELALEPDIVIEALSQLRCAGKVEGKDIGPK